MPVKGHRWSLTITNNHETDKTFRGEVKDPSVGVYLLTQSWLHFYSGSGMPFKSNFGIQVRIPTVIYGHQQNAWCIIIHCLCA